MNILQDFASSTLWTVTAVLILITVIAGLIRRFGPALLCLLAELTAALLAALCTQPLCAAWYDKKGAAVLTALLEEQTGFAFGADSFFASLLRSLSVSLLTVVCFFGAFLLIRILLGIPVLIFRKKLLRARPEKLFRSRGLGALLGLVGGLIMCFCFFLPIAGTAARAEEVITEAERLSASLLPAEVREALEEGSLSRRSCSLFRLIDQAGAKLVYDRLETVRTEDGSFRWWEVLRDLLKTLLTLTREDASAAELTEAVLGSELLRRAVPELLQQTGKAWKNGESFLHLEPPQTTFDLRFLYDMMAASTPATLEADVKMLCELYVLFRDAKSFPSGEASSEGQDPLPSWEEMLQDESFTDALVDILGGNEAHPALLPDTLDSLLSAVKTEIDLPWLDEDLLQVDREAYLALSPEDREAEDRLISDVLRQVFEELARYDNDAEAYIGQNDFEDLCRLTGSSVLLGKMTRALDGLIR